MSIQSELDAAFTEIGGRFKAFVSGAGTRVSVDGQPVATLDIDSTPAKLAREIAQLHGAVAISYEPYSVNSGTAQTSGIIYLAKMLVADNGTVSRIGHILNTVAAGLTAGQNFVGLYNSAGVRVGVSADLSSVWTTGASTTVPKDIPLVSPVAVSPGFYYVASLANGTTGPAIGRTGSAGPVNGFLTAAQGFRWAQYGTAQTVLPDTITLANATAHALPQWWALL